MSNRLIILGAGGHGRSVANIALQGDANRNIVFVDPELVETQLMGFPVVKETPDEEGDEYFVAVGSNKMRRKLIEELGERPIVNIKSPTAHIGVEAELGRGIFLGHNSQVGPMAKVHDGVIVNNGANVEHEVEVGAMSQITPGAIIAGRTRVGENCFFGLGSMVIDQLKITDNVTIGAGGVVIDDINEPGTYAGVPVRKISGETH